MVRDKTHSCPSSAKEPCFKSSGGYFEYSKESRVGNGQGEGQIQLSLFSSRRLGSG